MAVGMQRSDAIRQTVLSLIDETFGSDAAFERAVGLPAKTVNNWRRGRSSSYMKILPEIAAVFGVRGGDLLAATGSPDANEAELVRLWRESDRLPPATREALFESVKTVMQLYLASHK